MFVLFVDVVSIQQCRVKRNRYQGFENNGYIFDGKDYVRIIIDGGDGKNRGWMYEICGEKLTFGEFRSILQETCHFHMNVNRRGCGDECYVLFSHYCQFFRMKDDDIIPAPYKTSISNEFNNVYYIQYPTDFFVYFHRNKIPISAQKAQKCAKMAKCLVLRKLQACKDDHNFLDKYTDNKLKNIEKHLITNDHGSLLPFGDCHYGTECPQFMQLLDTSGTEDVNIKHRIHMRLFRHRPHHLVTNSNVYSDDMKTSQLFTYVDINTYKKPNMITFMARDCCESVLRNFNNNNATVAENVMLL